MTAARLLASQLAEGRQGVAIALATAGSAELVTTQAGVEELPGAALLEQRVTQAVPRALQARRRAMGIAAVPLQFAILRLSFASSA